MANCSPKTNCGKKEDLSPGGNYEEDAGKLTGNQKFKELVSTLPREKGFITEHLYQYQGFWFRKELLEAIISDQQRNVKVRPTDILLVTYPKSGTTWLKALLFAIFNRSRHNFDSPSHSLLSTNPHDCFPFLEEVHVNDNPTSLDESIPLSNTHIPYVLLPKSILASGCRIVYLYRNTKDVLLSLWKFASKLRHKELPLLSLEEAFENFGKGVSPYGPYWDHVLGYWKASLEWPNRILFLKYEDLQNETIVHVKKLAEFMGKPFSLEEDRDGTIHKIIQLCSFENLSNLGVNKTGVRPSGSHFVFENNAFFRQGRVGDWENHLTAEMAERLDRITEEKYQGTGLLKEN